MQQPAVPAEKPVVNQPSVVPAQPARAGFDPLSAAAGIELPESVALSVPFSVQAPYADWNPPFDEACEEVSLLMAEFALRGNALPKETANEEIKELASWEEAEGYAVDITVAELASIARERFGRKTAVYSGNDVTIENIQRLLAAGYPVIIPAAGQHLGNPYFSGDGPPYHMLVITGYKSGGIFSDLEFVTNDPGTKRGEGYTYDADVILDVIHDWTGDKETILSGGKTILVIAK